MGLTTIPEEVDGSLGRTKEDLDVPPNLVEYTPSAERNVLTQAVAELCEAMGLETGLTAGSLEMLKRVVNDPAGARPSDMVVVDDFYFVDTDVWTERELTTGVVNVIDGDGDGVALAVTMAGILMLKTVANADEAGISDTINWFNGKNNPIFQAKILTPSDITNNALSLGLTDDITSHGDYAYIEATPTGWDVFCGRSGASTDTDTNLGTCEVDTEYDIRIEVTSNDKVEFYVDDVLIKTLDAADSVIWESTPVGRFALLVSAEAATNRAYVDYMDLRLTRARIGGE